jgi:flagellar assembly protein FliH
VRSSSALAAARMNMSELPWAALAERGGFSADPRFASDAAASLKPVPVDPLAEAHAAGFAAGFAEAEAAAAAQLETAMVGRAAIDLALVKANAELEEALRQRLRATVEALCGEVFALAARDPDWLSRRIAAAAALLARADDDRLLRLHPSDIALLGDAVSDLPVEPDPALAPGSLRIEGPNGGVSEGPEVWQRSLAEALSQC